jgi:hypothetical protein
MKRSDRVRAPNEELERPSIIGHTAEHWLELGDQAIYVAAAILFLAAAAAMGGYSIVTFIRHIGDDFPLQLVTFINDLLLVLIILEILGTIRSYLLTGTTSLAHFSTSASSRRQGASSLSGPPARSEEPLVIPRFVIA